MGIEKIEQSDRLTEVKAPTDDALSQDGWPWQLAAAERVNQGLAMVEAGRERISSLFRPGNSARGFMDDPVTRRMMEALDGASALDLKNPLDRLEAEVEQHQPAEGTPDFDIPEGEEVRPRITRQSDPVESPDQIPSA